MKSLAQLFVCVSTLSLSFTSQVFYDALRKNVQNILTRFRGEHAPVYIEFSCDLGLPFVQQLNVSQLSLGIPNRVHSLIPSKTRSFEYAKTLANANDDDKIFLVVVCNHRSTAPMDISAVPRLAPTVGVLRFIMSEVSFPPHSTTVIWYSMQADDRRPMTLRASPYAQLYAVLDSRTGEFSFSSSRYLVKRYYNGFLRLHIGLDGVTLDHFKMDDLTFGVSSLRNIYIRKISFLHAERLLVITTLEDPTDANFSAVVSLDHSQARTTSENFRIASTSPLIAVARVPTVTKTTQVAKSVFHWYVWLPLILCALTASLALHYVNEDFRLIFPMLLLYVAFPVQFKFTNKSRQYFFIIGLWIFLLQVIGIGFKGDITSSMQALPENRVQKVSGCLRFVTDLQKNWTVGVILSDNVNTFFRTELAVILRGRAFCKSPDGLGMLRESLLRNVSLYKMDSEFPLSEDLHLDMKAIQISHNGRVVKSTTKSSVDSRELCCYRVAHLALAHAISQRRYFRDTRVDEAAHFEKEWNRVKGLELSPAYLNKICTNKEDDPLDGSRSLTVHRHQLLRKRRRCFRLEDMYPHQHRIVVEDLNFSLMFILVGLVLSFGGFLVEVTLCCLKRSET